MKTRIRYFKVFLPVVLVLFMASLSCANDVNTGSTKVLSFDEIGNNPEETSTKICRAFAVIVPFLILAAVGALFIWLCYKIFRRFPTMFILWVGLIAIVLTCLFPPWLQLAKFPYSDRLISENAGYQFLFSPPTALARINIRTLGLQCAIIGIITAGLLYTVWSRKNKK